MSRRKDPRDGRVGHALVERGIAVYFTPAFKLVQQLLAAKRDLELPRLPRKLDRCDVIVPDDLGYVQQAADDAEVLFTLMAERYERRSLVVVTNRPFRDWPKVFPDALNAQVIAERLTERSEHFVLDGKGYGTRGGQKATS